MGCTSDYIEYLSEKLRPLGEVNARKMMGDYVIYVNGKCVITACDNTAYIKKLPAIESIMAGGECGRPYPGAKEAYILDFADMNKALKVIDTAWDALPYPKTKKK